MEALDAKTVVIKMAFPKANMLSSFAFQRYLWMMPVEADGNFDPKTEMRGSGPWRLIKWKPSGRAFERNPTGTLSHLSSRAFTSPLSASMPSAARSCSQATSGPTCQQHRSHPRRRHRRDEERTAQALDLPETFPDARRPLFTFGFLPNSPFNDVRIRRAASMVLDRDSWIDAFYGVSLQERRADS